MKYIYAINYKGKTRYRVVVCTQGRRKIHLGYADSIEKAKEIRNKFFGITNDLIKKKIEFNNLCNKSCNYLRFRIK